MKPRFGLEAEFVRDQRGPDLSDAQPELFTITVSHPAPGVTVVAVGGEIDIASSPELSRRLDAVDAAGPFHVVVDLSGLTFVDSSGIRSLVVSAREMEGRGGAMVLAAPQSHVQRVFSTVHLSDVIAIEPTLDAALATIGTPAG